MRPTTPKREPSGSKAETVAGPMPGIGGMMKMAEAARRVQTMARIQYAQGHQAYSARREEKSAPMMKPLGATAPKREKTMFLRRPVGYVLPRMANALGSKMAGPMPCRARHAEKKMAEWE